MICHCTVRWSHLLLCTDWVYSKSVDHTWAIQHRKISKIIKILIGNSFLVIKRGNSKFWERKSVLLETCAHDFSSFFHLSVTDTKKPTCKNLWSSKFDSLGKCLKIVEIFLHLISLYSCKYMCLNATQAYIIEWTKLSREERRECKSLAERYGEHQ